MNTGIRLRALLAFCCAAALAGCASVGAGGSAPSPQGMSGLPPLANAAAATNVAGRYSGKFRLKTTVVGNVSFNLTQSGSAVGGSLKLVLAKRTIGEPVAMTLDATANTLTGTAVDASGKQPCTYALRATYNPKTFIFRGTSSPLTCTGKVANFTTTERCFYNTGSSADAIRPNAHGIIEC